MLEARRPYLIELKERLDLPAGLRGKANPKSSTGRIDVFTRVITDHSDRFDEIAPGYQGRPVPRGRAAVLRRPGPRGPDPEPAPPLHGPAVADRRRDPPGPRSEPILYNAGTPVPVDDLVLSERALPRPRPARRRAGAGRALHPRQRAAPRPDVGGRGRPRRRSGTRSSGRTGDRLVLSPKRFYLLMSHEAVSIPPNLAAEMTAYDPTSGELRTHYAGFFDPGFGYDPGGGSVAPRRARGARPRRPVHGRERPGGVQADLRAHARGADRPLRDRHRLVVPAAGRDPEPLLPPCTGVVPTRTHNRRGRSVCPRSCSPGTRDRLSSDRRPRRQLHRKRPQRQSAAPVASALANTATTVSTTVTTATGQVASSLPGRRNGHQCRHGYQHERRRSRHRQHDDNDAKRRGIGAPRVQQNFGFQGRNNGSKVNAAKFRCPGSAVHPSRYMVECRGGM